MKVWISYLLDQLEAYSPECTFDVSDERASRVSRVCSFAPADVLRANTLYLCLEAAPDKGADIPETACFIVKRRANAGHLHRRIILDRPPAQDELLNILWDGADRYQSWLEELLHLSLTRAEPQAFLDTAATLLENPIMIQDPFYTVAAITKGASVKDYPFFDFGGTQRPMPEFLLHSQREARTIKRYSVGEEGRGIVREYDGKIEVIHNVLYNGNLCACIISAVSRAALTQGRFDLLMDFCHCFRYSLNTSLPELTPGSITNFAFEQLVRFGDPGAMRNLLRPREDWKFMTAVLKIHAAESEIIGYLPQIQEVLPSSAACLYNDRISVILCVSDRDSDTVFHQYQYQRLESLGEVLNGVFGLSYQMTSLAGMSAALQQSEKALKLPRLPGMEGAAREPGSRLSFYEDVAMTDILEGAFAGVGAEQFFPPELAALRHSDLQTGENNCEILYYYLLTGKSLAGTSEVLHIHRSTIVYRLERMKERFGLRFDQAARNQLYLLCCMSHQLQRERQREGVEPQ